MPNIHKRDSISAQNNGKLRYKKRRDYLRSVVNVLSRKYNLAPRGMDVNIDGNVPISGGLSSSSALVVAWTNFILNMHGFSPDRKKLADLAFSAEVTEFQEPGGIMDHLSSVYGNLNLFKFYPETSRVPIKLPENFPVIIAGFMGRKDTLGTLGRIRWKIFDGMKKIEHVSKENIYQKLQTIQIEELEGNLRKEEYLVCKGAILNREITKHGLELLTKNTTIDWQEIGNLLIDQHKILSENFQTSTIPINRAIEKVVEAGAYGAKINGSGGGGSFISLAPPEKAKEVESTIRRIGGRTYQVKPSEGARYL